MAGLDTAVWDETVTDPSAQSTVQSSAVVAVAVALTDPEISAKLLPALFRRLKKHTRAMCKRVCRMWRQWGRIMAVRTSALPDDALRIIMRHLRRPERPSNLYDWTWNPRPSSALVACSAATCRRWARIMHFCAISLSSVIDGTLASAQLHRRLRSQCFAHPVRRTTRRQSKRHSFHPPPPMRPLRWLLLRILRFLDQAAVAMLACVGRRLRALVRIRRSADEFWQRVEPRCLSNVLLQVGVHPGDARCCMRVARSWLWSTRLLVRDLKLRWSAEADVAHVLNRFLKLRSIRATGVSADNAGGFGRALSAYSAIRAVHESMRLTGNARREGLHSLWVVGWAGDACATLDARGVAALVEAGGRAMVRLTALDLSQNDVGEYGRTRCQLAGVRLSAVAQRTKHAWGRFIDIVQRDSARLATCDMRHTTCNEQPASKPHATRPAQRTEHRVRRCPC